MKSRRVLRVILVEQLGERIKAAAIRLNNGIVIEAPWHLRAVEIAAEKGYFSEFGIHDREELYAAAPDTDEFGVEEGFTTTDGRFISRDEAYELAVSQGLSVSNSPVGSLDSYDVQLRTA